MAANDHLSDVQFFHGTADKHEPDDVIDPSQPHSKTFAASHPDRLYLHRDAGVAKDFGRMAAYRKGMDPEEGKAYHVEPQGDVHKDYTMARQTSGEGAYMTGSPVKVIGES